jgi:hypothetical protein
MCHHTLDPTRLSAIGLNASKSDASSSLTAFPFIFSGLLPIYPAFYRRLVAGRLGRCNSEPELHCNPVGLVLNYFVGRSLPTGGSLERHLRHLYPLPENSPFPTSSGEQKVVATNFRLFTSGFHLRLSLPTLPFSQIVLRSA